MGAGSGMDTSDEEMGAESGMDTSEILWCCQGIPIEVGLNLRI